MKTFYLRNSVWNDTSFILSSDSEVHVWGLGKCAHSLESGRPACTKAHRARTLHSGEAFGGQIKVLFGILLSTPIK